MKTFTGRALSNRTRSSWRSCSRRTIFKRAYWCSHQIRKSSAIRGLFYCVQTGARIPLDLTESNRLRSSKMPHAWGSSDPGPTKSREKLSLSTWKKYQLVCFPTAYSIRKWPSKVSSREFTTLSSLSWSPLSARTSTSSPISTSSRSKTSHRSIQMNSPSWSTKPQAAEPSHPLSN